MVSKILRITATVIIITIIVIIGSVWVWDQNGKMVFHIQNLETDEYLTIIVRSAPWADYNWVFLGKKSILNPLPWSEYLLTKGEMSIGYDGKNWILKNCIDQESTFKEKPENFVGCNFDPIPEQNVLYYPYSITTQNGL